MTRGRKHTNEWKAAASARLNKWLPEDLALLTTTYEKARLDRRLDLTALATALRRGKAVVSRKARQLGLTDRRRVLRKERYEYKYPYKSVAKYTDEERRVVKSARQKAWIAEHGHPRGALGMRHSEEVRAKISASHLALAATGVHPGQRPRTEEQRLKQSRAMTHRLTTGSNVYSRCKHGRRPDLDNQFFRSRWEANYARFLNLLKSQGQIVTWEYEKETFWFEKIRRGVRSYTPDFRVSEPAGRVYFVEVKGWMDPKSATKIKRMAKYHPAVDLRVVGQKAYTEIAKKLAGAIPCWEYDDRNRA